MATTNGDGPFRKVKAWVATEGRWSFEGATAHYLKPERADYAVGTVLTDIRGSDVTVRFGATLKAIPDPPPGENATAAGAILGVGGPERRDVVVGLGGWGSAYFIAQFKPGSGYVPLDHGGTLANLIPHQRYQVEAIQRGQMVALSIDAVRVFEVRLPEPLGGN